MNSTPLSISDSVQADSIQNSKKREQFFVSIKERYRLNHPLSQKETYHIVLDLGSHPLEYSVGDCIGIYPSNDLHIVNSILQSLNASGEEVIHDRNLDAYSLRDFLEKKANLSRVSRKLVEQICTKLPLSHPLVVKLANDSKEEFKNFLERSDVEDLLKKHSPLDLTPQELCNHLSPLMPRFYSIASSSLAVGRELHLTVALTQYTSNQSLRQGVCSHFLCHLAPLNEAVVPIFLQKAEEFILSDVSFEKPIIMIGPGTGVAPFRGFMQERIKKKASKQNWLFFGERNQALDFYYEDYWKDLEQRGLLKLGLAFSRDQEEKIYVQHRMLEHSKELWSWISQGAFIYVCGDASRMAKDVDKTLLHIASTEGHLSEIEAKTFMKSLKQEKRYLRDVY